MSFDTTDQFGDSLAACCISEVFFFSFFLCDKETCA